jgi:hypothetical protein
MTPVSRITTAVRDAQALLAAYIEPGPRDCEKTINDLLDILDDYQLIEALEEVENAGPEKEGLSGPLQNQHARTP